MLFAHVCVCVCVCVRGNVCTHVADVAYAQLQHVLSEGRVSRMCIVYIYYVLRDDVCASMYVQVCVCVVMGVRTSLMSRMLS